MDEIEPFQRWTIELEYLQFYAIIIIVDGDNGIAGVTAVSYLNL